MKILTRLAAAMAAIVLVHQPARACPLVCVQTSSASEITDPASVTFRLEISCPVVGQRDYISALASSFELPNGTLLSTGYVGSLFPIGGPDVGGVAVYNGSPVVREYTVPLDYETCKLQPGAIVGADGVVTLDNLVTGRSLYWYIDHKVGFECGTPIVCRPPAVGTGATRTIGFWKTHVEALDRCVAGGVDLGFGALSLDQALGLLWTNPAKYSGLQRATLLLGRQLLAASCNVSQFGASPAEFSVADAVAAIVARDCAAMMDLYPRIDAFNNQNDNVALPFDPGASLGVGARDLAGDPGLPAGSCAP